MRKAAKINSLKGALVNRKPISLEDSKGKIHVFESYRDCNAKTGIPLRFFPILITSKKPKRDTKYAWVYQWKYISS